MQTLMVADTAWGIGGESVLSQLAPHVAAAFTELIRMRPADVDAPTLGALRAVTADAMTLPPLSGARVDDEPPRALVDFAEAFAVDVAGLRGSTRAAWRDYTVGQAWSATQMIYVADYGPRVRAALDQLFTPDEWLEPPPMGVCEPSHVVAAFHNEVARGRVLDPITAELLRLRCARQHGSRMQMSRRSVNAIGAGANSRTFEQIDRHRLSTLPSKAKAALRLVDAMIHTPATFNPSDIDAVRSDLSPREAVAVVLDVARHAVHKISVALGEENFVDTPSKIEFFETDADGRTILV